MKTHKVLLLAIAAFLVAFHPARATVPSANCFLQYTLTTNPQALPVTFVFQNAGDLLVLDTRAHAAPVTLTLNSDYSVSGGSGSTGTINTIPGGANGVQVGDVITVSRAVPLTQTTSFTNTGPLTASMIGQSLDKLTQITQQVNLNGGRSLQFQGDETLSGIMPLAARKGNVVGFDSNGALTFYAFQSGSVLPQSVQGTANQVLVNGTSGTPTTGAVILTTPQSIGLGSTVQFQKIGIGATPNANADVYINHATPALSAQASVNLVGTVTAPAATQLFPNGFRDNTAYAASTAADAYASFDAQAGMSGSVNLNHFYGYQSRIQYSSTGTLDVMAGYASTNMGVAVGSTVTKLRGFYVAQPTISGTATALDGIYIDALSGAGTVTAINIAGANNVAMAGGQIWTSAALAPATTPSRLAVTFDQASQTGIDVMNSNATATGSMIKFYTTAATLMGSITQTNSTTIAYNTSSDARLKENVRPMNDSGKIIDSLRPRVFDWKWGGKGYHGFVAQELSTSFPEAVTKGDDGDKVETPWSVDYGKLTPVLAAEAQSLRSRVSNLEYEVALLAVILFCHVAYTLFKRK